jgi:serine/threonine protein kinase
MSGKKYAKINNYNLVELLGEGLTSCVYKAIKKHRDWGVEQTVALKILKSKDLVPTFAQEVNALGKVDSPHCVKLYDWIETQKTPVLVLEYLDGITLDECSRRIRFSQSLIDEIVAQAQAGLKDLQKNNLKHGDLSPKNIFITKQGVVKLLDFGFSSQKKAMAGTVAYLSPEAWEKYEYTAQSDLFSLGIIKHELETGERIYTRDQARQRMESLKDTNSLVCAEGEGRRFLPLASTAKQREELAKTIVDLKNSKKESLQTTILAEPIIRGEAKRPSAPWVACLVGALIMVYSHALHPATVFDGSANLFRLEVRSFRWAQINLYQKRNDKMVLLKKQYTPFLHKGLSSGIYKIQWTMPSRQGSISVHLNKNRRILLP